MTAVTSIDPQCLKDWLTDGDEIAVLDIRDLGPFSRGHLWLAVNIPYDRLELRIRRFVPRLSTRIVLCDQDDGLARRAASALRAIGYSDIAILEGGITAWQTAGNDLVEGNYVIAHSFGYFLKEHYQIPTIAAADLSAKIESHEDCVILDCRPFEDYQSASLPGSVCTPAAELIHTIRDIAPDPKTQIVVHCGGVTRGLLGAQALDLAAIENPVWFLQDGTKGWLAAGLELQSDGADSPHIGSSAARSFASAVGKALTARFALRSITPKELEVWRAEAEQRTTYVIDVRRPEEFRDAHYPGAISIPGGELAGMTIDHIATRRARLCLVADEVSARAEITALWMLQLGWPEVVILRGWQELADLESGPELDLATDLEQRDIPTLSAPALAAQLESQDTVIVDFASSQTHAAGHIPGAFWMLRSDLPLRISELPTAGAYAVTSPTGRMAKLIAAEMAQLTEGPVFALSGGTNAWYSADFDLEPGLPHPLSAIDDLENLTSAPLPADPKAARAFHASYNAWRRRLFDQYKAQNLSQFHMLT